jgi:hypothetical protein
MSVHALLTDAQEVASPNLESSNQLFETLEEWNDYLERPCPRMPGTGEIFGRQSATDRDRRQLNDFDLLWRLGQDL